MIEINAEDPIISIRPFDEAQPPGCRYALQQRQ